MTETEKVVAGRVVAYAHVYNGGAITATRIFFADGTELLLAGDLQFPTIITVSITYVEKGSKPNELKKVELLAG